MPATLRELTASRFEPLGPKAREVLLYVAALARPTLDVVTAATGEDAGAAIEAAVAAGVVEVDGLRLRFTHPLLASALYGSASSDDRARVHRRLADVVEDAEERGRHLGAAATAPDARSRRRSTLRRRQRVPAALPPRRPSSSRSPSDSRRATTRPPS